MSEEPMNIFSAISDYPATVTCPFSACVRCGALAFGVVFEAYPRDEYITDGTGKVRRRFDFIESNPICDCDQTIWLGDDNSPYEVTQVFAVAENPAKG